LTIIANWLYALIGIGGPRRQAGRRGSVEHFADPQLGDFEDEFFQALHFYCYPGGIVDPERLDELDRAYWFLDEVARGDVDAFVATKQEWKLHAGIPVYLIELGGFMLAFAIAEDPDLAAPIVVAIACAPRDSIEAEAFWTSVVGPRVNALL
jgi:hypothetical protein